MGILWGVQEEARQAGQASALLQTEVERLGAGLKQREQRLAHSAAALEVVQREVGGLRADLRRGDAETGSLAREVDRLTEGLQAKTEEAASLAAALEQQRKRLHAQLQRWGRTTSGLHSTPALARGRKKAWAALDLDNSIACRPVPHTGFGSWT